MLQLLLLSVTSMVHVILERTAKTVHRIVLRRLKAIPTHNIAVMVTLDQTVETPTAFVHWVLLLRPQPLRLQLVISVPIALPQARRIVIFVATASGTTAAVYASLGNGIRSLIHICTSQYTWFLLSEEMSDWLGALHRLSYGRIVAHLHVDAHD